MRFLVSLFDNFLSTIFFRLLTHVQGGFYFSGIGKFRGVVKGTYEETENQFQCFFQGNKVWAEIGCSECTLKKVTSCGTV